MRGVREPLFCYQPVTEPARLTSSQLDDMAVSYSRSREFAGDWHMRVVIDEGIQRNRNLA